MTSDISDTIKYLSLMQEARKKLNEEMDEKVSEQLKLFHSQIFDKYPGLVAVRWEQYTPNFNDGDTCEFDASYPSIFLEENEIDVTKSLIESDDLEYNGKAYRSLYNGWNIENSTAIEMEVFRLIQDIHQETLSALRSLYGDGYKITLYRDGNVDIVEYHDHE